MAPVRQFKNSMAIIRLVQTLWPEARWFCLIAVKGHSVMPCVLYPYVYGMVIIASSPSLIGDACFSQ